MDEIPGLLCLSLVASLEVSDTKSDILDELLEQAKASRDAPEAVPGEHRDADVTGSSLLDHLLDKAMKEKVSRDSDSVSSGAITQDQESSRSQEDDGQKSRFKYLFFEILTPDEYNDIVYLGEDLMDPMEESMAALDKMTEKTTHRDHFNYLEENSPVKYEYKSKLMNPPTKPEPSTEVSVRNDEVDVRRTKMESLLKRMTERYRVRSQETTTDSKEGIKTQKLKNMIDILEEKLDKYDHKEEPKEKEISSRRIDPESSYLNKLEERGIQSTRTTPSGYSYNKNKYTTTTSKPGRNQEEVKEKWNQAMDDLADKLSRKSSGIHRINLDEMLDLDMLEVPESDQKSSDSYPGTTAVPPSNFYKPKRQIHPKLTYGRLDFGDIHRPSSKLKDLIREKEELSRVSSESAIKSLPPISRYHDQEPVYKPTTVVRPDECPYIPRRPYTECYNAPPSECLDIGYPDPNCSPGSLCCYDGCINLCWRNPNLPPKLPPLSPPPSEYSTLAPAHYSTTPSPTPKVYGQSTPHVTSPNPVKPFIQVHDYSTPEYLVTTPHPPRHEALKPEYVPPLGNLDAVHHEHHGYKHTPQSSTIYPPPSSEYKQPSISFIAKGESGGATYSTMVPPHKEYYKEAKALDYTAQMQKYHAPTKEYLPPVKEHMVSYQAPSREYLPPEHHSTPTPAYMSTYNPPSKDYLPPGPSSTIKPPSTSYLPPHSTIKPTYKDVLTKGYIPPANLVHEAVHKGSPIPHLMSTTYAPPSKAYLPPQHSTTYKPTYKTTTIKPSHHLKEYLPPSKDYLPPPAIVHHDHQMAHMSPPKKEYIPPEHMSHMSPPEKQYLPPDHMSHMTPPDKQYLPPDYEVHGEHYHAQEHMAHMAPPEKEYLPPDYMSHMIPPEKGYVPPEHMSHMSPPHKSYIPPDHMKSMHPPGKDYHPPDYMYKMQPPKKSYVPPHHMSHLVPPKESYDKPHYTVCPHFTLREKTECPTIKHQCWSPGVPDEDCPHHGLCCFDGCNNVCLDSSYPAKGYHIPSHDAYLVPGHKYVPSPKPEDKALFHHRTLHAPSKEYLPPSEAVYHLVDRPEDYENDLPTSYLPPVKDYLPPAKEHLVKHVHKPSYEPPTHEYLPPPHSKPVKDEKHPYASYLPPSKDYLPPPPIIHGEEPTHHLDELEYEVSTSKGRTKSFVYH